MARVTDPDVRELIPSTTITDLTVYITAANLLVNRLADSTCGADLTDDELTEIERWLSAHYATVSDPSQGIVEEKVENASVKLSRGNVNSQMGILSTQFGQMANTLANGCLVELDKRKVTFAAVGGADYSD